MVIVLWPSNAEIASRDMPRLIAWVARVCRSWWAWTCPMPAAVGEQQRAVLPVRSGREPLIDHGFELRVQRDVAVVVEFADRDPQPVGRPDLDNGVGGETEEFPVGGVVEELGERFVLDGHVGGVDRWPGRCVGVFPLDDPAEEGTEMTHP